MKKKKKKQQNIFIWFNIKGSGDFSEKLFSQLVKKFCSEKYAYKAKKQPIKIKVQLNSFIYATNF